MESLFPNFDIGLATCSSPIITVHTGHIVYEVVSKAINLNEGCYNKLFQEDSRQASE